MNNDKGSGKRPCALIKCTFDYIPADVFCLCTSQEFSKEVEGKSGLKSSVVTEGNQLLRLKKVDTVVLRSDLARIDTQWTELLTRIPVVQEKLHQVLSHAVQLNRLSHCRANWINPFCCFTCIWKFSHRVALKLAACMFCFVFLCLFNMLVNLSLRFKWRSWPLVMQFPSCVTGFHWWRMSLRRMKKTWRVQSGQMWFRTTCKNTR